MHSRTFTSFIGFFLLVVLNFLGSPKLFAQADMVDLRFQTEVDCNQNVLSVTLQVKVRADSFRIGTSSILFNYDKTVLSYIDYESITFDENHTVNIFGSDTPVWSPHEFNGSVAGTGNLTLLINIAAASLPTIHTEWMDIGKARFDVTNLNGNPNLVFDIGNTNFNKYDPNDGTAAPDKGDFLSFTNVLATECGCKAPSVRNSTFSFDCFQSSIIADFVPNETVSNPTFSISSNPTKGVASINADGQLTYIADDFFCGTDQFSYQICNEGDMQCCREATVLISFSDEEAPTFSNPPADLTVSCNEIPVFEGIAATDGCSEIQLLQNETSQAGPCANSQILTRIWTAFDGCGNNVAHTQNITVIDDIAPIIFCPADITVSCGDDISLNSISGAEAFESCSLVTLSFADEGEMPLDCVEPVTISRTWTATDECGNNSTCIQLITVEGDTCAPTISRVITEYLCEGATVNLNFLMGFTQNDELTVLDGNEQPIANPNLFTFPLTGCQTGNFEFNFQKYNAAQCLVENSRLIVKTIPNKLFSPVVSEDKCTVGILLECPELYEVTWFDGVNSGNGTTYIATPGTSGFAYFTMTYIDENLPNSIDLFCFQSSHEIAFDCGISCPPGLQETLEVTGCEGDFINIAAILQLTQGDSLVPSITIDNLFDFELITTDTTCGIVKDEIEFAIYDENGCLVRSVLLLMDIIKKTSATIRHEADFCQVYLDLACPELYEVTWKDDKNNTGVGSDFQGTSNTSGLVTFYVSLVDTTLLNYSCAVDSFFADYSCQNNCPETFVRDEKFTVCAETSFNIFERLALPTDKEYVIENELVTAGVYEIGNAFGCEIGTKNIVLKDYGVNQCLREIINIEFTILPAVYGGILLNVDSSCRVELGVECPEHYSVTWEDSNGNSGEGINYIAEENTSGTVVFTVNYLPEMFILSEVELACMSQTFEAEFNCTSDCPAIAERAESFLVCGGTIVNIFDNLTLSADRNYVIEDEVIVDGVYDLSDPFPFGCVLQDKVVQINGYDANQCLVEVINLTITVLPSFYGHVDTISTLACELRFRVECSELYTVRWEDSFGNTGEGFDYSAQDNSQGTVKWSVDFSDVGFISNFDSAYINLDCLSQTFEASFNCNTDDCPATTEREASLIACAGTSLNVFDKLPLLSTLTYVSEDDDLIEGVYQIDGNPFGCEIGTKIFTVNGYDENQCLVEIIQVSINILPTIYGELVTNNEDSCTVELFVECPDHYTIRWEDSEGQNGTGSWYTPAENTSGSVQFFVEFLVNDIALPAQEFACGREIFEASFNCSSACPELTERNESITACAGTTINIYDNIPLLSTLNYVFDNDDIIDGVYQIGNPFGCEVGEKTYQINGYDVNQCLIEVITVSITVYPEIFGDIITQNGEGCDVMLILECTDFNIVTWEDSEGQTGVGNFYTPAENTSGTVKFYVEYITNDSIFSIGEEGCNTTVFEAAYNCNKECPETTERAASFAACAGTTINIFNEVPLVSILNYVIEEDEIIDGVYQIDNPFGCEVGEKTYQIKGYDVNQCLIEIITVSITVYPEIFGDIVTTADVACGVSLLLECPQNYIVNWTDSEGNSGVGMDYTAVENTAGIVTFIVEYLKDDIILSEVELGCLSQIFEAEFDCRTGCPEPIEETVVIAGCQGEVINLKERLNFSENLFYTILDNVNNLSIDQLVLENNNTNCTIEFYDILIEVIDENGCLLKFLTIKFQVSPEILAIVVFDTVGCGVQLDLPCLENYNIIWSDNLGNIGEGVNYENEEGATGVVKFEIIFNSPNLTDELVNTSCHSLTIEQAFGCVGTPCGLEHKGIVFDSSNRDGAGIDENVFADCGLLIELSDGTILNPLILPEGVALIAGQELIFSFVERTDIVSLCEQGRLVEIICLENTCPEKGTPCTDGDLATINDAHDGNCNCIGESVPEVESEIDLRFRPSLDCETNAYCVTIQAKAQRKDFAIGTSSIMISYNENALEFSNYTSTQFDEAATCIGGTSSPWDKHQYDASSVPGKMCLTMFLESEGASCPEITAADWEDIGQICFDIMDNEASPNITFDTSKTHFNSSSPNDGTAAIKIGALHEISTDDAFACTVNDVAVTNEVAMKAYLQGAYNVNSGRMTDQLRRKGFIPLTEPYTGLQSFIHFGAGGGETTTNEVLQTNGKDAIVDWVFVELRSALDAKTIIATRAALIQADGDVVEVDGVSNIQFMVPNDNYFISIKHRNHLGAMTREPVLLSGNGTEIVDFTNPDTPTYGTNAQTQIKNVMTLWGGNANPDNYIILAGGGLGLPDRDMIFFDIFLSLWYANPDVLIHYNSVLQGYYGSDTNLDGKVKYQGPRNDIDAIIFFNVLFHPENTEYRLNFSISEQIP